MVSMVETASRSDRNDAAMESLIPKSEPVPDGSISSTMSTPDAEVEPLTQDTTQTQKRKGGRKPIYATSEERKQRNRQAQAAFRERRTEYIRQLETTIKRNEESLQSLQQSHRSAADECLMLRYKNSLLERILLEKGIDVQAELRLKTGAPGSTAKPAPARTKSAMPRPTQRHPAAIASKPEAYAISQREGTYGVASPQFQPTPTSHVSSPSHAKSPGYGFQGGGMSPVEVNGPPNGRPQLLPQPRSFTSQTSPGGISMPQTDPNEKARGPRGARIAANYYPSPFQKHYDQLEQEYDAQADLVDEDHEGSVHAPYVPGFTPQSVASGSHNMSGYNPPAEGAHADYGNANQLMAQYEPMLDADPFGLSASMHFPTPFNYDQNNPRS
ncbi:BZIP transcription factor [Penicillium ucsense]|uniref:BZIP transcription factor n=1 Tax=Penicillium ucsense TaxID=2839758 RepID=A0A8J8WK36_9EURO|nr:BZIP transcription factor [Penicillium ucsense]KAF7733841.1 BZIP transcription factor [Penicillium ucsense]